MTGNGPEPRAEYTRRLEARRREAARHARADLAFSGARLGVAIAAGVMAWLSLGPDLFSLRWLALPGAVFVTLIFMHDRAIKRRRRAERAAAYYEGCLARVDGLWAQRGQAGGRFLQDDHLYAADLDLFGPGSLFELICSARTSAGEEALASWLRAPASAAEVRARHGAVEELRPRLDLREDLALLGEDVRSGLDPQALSSWGAAPALLPVPPASAAVALRLGLAALAVLSLAALSAWAAGWTGPAPLAGVALVQALLTRGMRDRVRSVVASSDKAARDLELLSQVLARIEAERFSAPRLASLRQALDTAGQPPSIRIARLSRLIALLDARRNQLFAPLAPLLTWTTQLALAIEAWRAASGRAVGRWLEAVGEVEALSSLAGYAYENPEDPFPEIVDAPGARAAAVFDATGLGHPLLPKDTCVRNDVLLGGELRALIVSGSNMSGKSTLLRAVGVACVLAAAGAPVRARRLRLSIVAVGASMRIQDSLQAGTSRFYAEIKKLRRILDLAGGQIPAMFLIDEVLHGTNSHDRRLGAEAILKSLVDRGAVGFITTHDLALAQIVDTLAPRAVNVHFEDHLEDGRMTFDYILRSGVVRKSNALALMRSVGLEV